MLKESLGTIEVYGLPAAIVAADVACKAANVTLIGYETTDGMGMVAVKIRGQVSAVASAIQAAKAASAQVSKVFSTSVIPRPNDQLDQVVYTDVTVGLEKPEPEVAAEPEPGPEPEPKPAAPVAPVEPAPAAEAPEPQPEAKTATPVEEAAAEPAPEKPKPASKAATTKAAPRTRSTKKQPVRRNS